MTLLEETLNLLKSDSRTFGEIAEGAGCGREWLAKLAQGRIAEPGVNRIERLNAFLKATQSETAA